MKAYGWIGLALLLVSEYCLFRKLEPFHSWFYCFAWWSYILLADNLLLVLRGSSLIYSRRRDLLPMLPLSIFIWLLFEAYNLVIRNWAYDEVPSALWQRWAGYTLAFATVLPGIFITSDLVAWVAGRDRKGALASDCEPLRETPASYPSGLFFALGIALSLAPLLWPRYFFFAVWLGPILLLDPLLEKLGAKSLFAVIGAGNRNRIWSLMAGGLLCGMFWEFWNYWAASKWIYTIPFFDKWKLFEMPLAGFLGFPPFALECWILYHLFVRILQRCGSPAARLVYWLVVGLACVVMYAAIDSRTVIRFTADLHRSHPSWQSGML
jgi:hypothetical protein